MANVTFIIGNGLDLSLGLETSYRHFYDSLSNRGIHLENRIFKAIQESQENWADFEFSVGQYTQYLEKIPEKDRKKESLKFHEELGEISEDLAKYLEEQEKLHEDAFEQANFTSTGYFDELPIGQRERVYTLLSQGGSTGMEFITLNYTKNVERIIRERNARLYSQGIRLGNVHHIHGDLLENMTLGVSDESQLSSALSGSEKDDLIKPTLIYSMNDGRIDTLKRLITNSSVIVIYGTSVGDTDKYIWEMVTDWLVKSPSHLVIMHMYDELYTATTRRSSRVQKQFISNAQEKLLRHSALDGNAIAELRNQIFVVHNTTKLFTP